MNREVIFREPGSHFPGNWEVNFQEPGSRHFPGNGKSFSENREVIFREPGSHFPGTGTSLILIMMIYSNFDELIVIEHLRMARRRPAAGFAAGKNKQNLPIRANAGPCSFVQIVSRALIAHARS